MFISQTFRIKDSKDFKLCFVFANLNRFLTINSFVLCKTFLWITQRDNCTTLAYDVKLGLLEPSTKSLNEQ